MSKFVENKHPSKPYAYWYITSSDPNSFAFTINYITNAHHFSMKTLADTYVYLLQKTSYSGDLYWKIHDFANSPDGTRDGYFMIHLLVEPENETDLHHILTVMEQVNNHYGIIRKQYPGNFDGWLAKVETIEVDGHAG